MRIGLTAIGVLGVLISLFSFLNLSYSADWPTWRADASRSATSTEELPAELHPQWSLHLAALKPAWTEDPRLQFDATYEPIVLGNMMFVSSSHNDSVTAVDIATGKQHWRFFTDGPVRFAPVGLNGRIYFGADDGCFYCVDAAKGTQIWKFRAAPTRRKVIGNERLISVWPMRGGPVLANDKIYFTVGVWPFEGTLLYTLDATSGDVLQVKGSERPDDAGVNYTSTTLKDLSPQGYLVASGENLFVPCGRDNVFGVNTKTGRRISVKYSAKGLTDYHVMAAGKWFFHGDKIVDIRKQRTSSLTAHRPVIDGERIFFTSKGRAVAYDLKNQITVEKKDRRGKIVKTLVPKRLWQFDENPITTVHMKAGNRIYGHHANTVFALDLPTADEKPTNSWKATVKGTPSSMLAANGRLFVVTKEGIIHCFGAIKTEVKIYRETPQTIEKKDERWADHAGALLRQAKTKDGYCLVLGIGEGNLIDELIRQSNFQIIAVDKDTQKVNSLRRRLDGRGLYGTRVVAHVDDPLSFQFPPFLANLIVSEDLKAAGLNKESLFVTRTFHALRPYGGIACFDLPADRHSSLAKTVAQCELPNAEFKRVGQLSTLSRVGALVGSADWTHEYGDPSNTLMSRDKLVKAPLGVLWFGGPASDGRLFYDRHQWGPSMAVIEGRMFIQGPEVFTAVDVYTGRILWQNRLAKGITPGRRANWGPAGFHFVAVKDAIYLAFPNKCVRLDPATGKEVSEFKLKNDKDLWGRIRVWKDQIIVPVFQPVEGGGPVPKKLIAMDRHTGKVNWTKESAQSFAMVSIGGDKVFCYEGLLKGLYQGADKIRKDGIPQAAPFLSIRALDVKSGDDLWDRTTTQIATWLAYSEEHDVLLTSNKQGIEARRGKNGEELWSKKAKGLGFRGHPENYWDKVIIWKDKILDQRGPGRSYSLLSGKPDTR
ncbi:MAG: PQQ-binding-like beta-propeller repeat protein, partial [Planctomycetes bacterium]|nr:PQQ-binding-like beta-propeller repeat protein [Planctomycetota bacterium]